MERKCQRVEETLAYHDLVRILVNTHPHPLFFPPNHQQQRPEEVELHWVQGRGMHSRVDLEATLRYKLILLLSDWLISISSSPSLQMLL